MNFKQQWDWQLNYIDDVKNIIKKLLPKIVNIKEAEPDDDLNHATDYKIKIDSGDIAIRIRRETKYRDITIRAFNGGHKTEIDKLRDGNCDWYLYIWTQNNKIVEWTFLDINKMRIAGLFENSRKITMNKDGRTGFIVYNVHELSKIGAVVAHHKNGTDK